MSGYYRPARPAARRRCVLGVDLGQRSTPAAVVVAELCDGEFTWDAVAWRWVPGLQGDVVGVRHVEALALGSAYGEVARRVWSVALAAGASEVWFDATGVGNGVKEILRWARPEGLRCGLRPVVLTGGREAAGECVPRWALMQRLAVEFECGRVRLAAGLGDWEALRGELLGLGADGRRRRGADDRAVALALAVWGLAGAGVAGERGEGRLV